MAGTLFRFLAAAAACALMAADLAASTAVRVLTPEDDIEEILEEAVDGDRFELAPGVYEVNLLIPEAVHLTGRKGAVIDAGGHGTAVLIRSPKAVVENLRIINYGGDLYQRDAGIRVADGADDVVIRNVEFEGPGFGIRADRNERLTVENCRIEGRRSLHVLERGDGIFLNYVKNPLLKNNIVRNVRDGFYFENVDKSRSTGNFFTGAQYGIHYMYTRDDYGADNIAAGVVGGFALMSSKRIAFENNTSRKTVEFGILLNVCDGCTVTGNRVEGVHNPKGRAALDTEGKGLFIYGTGANTVIGNWFSGADIGVGVALGGEGNVLSENAFVDNTIQVRYVGRRPLEWSLDGRGNYWSTFMGWDLNNDGVAEKPYQPNDSLDRLFWLYPEARFLMDSPVVALLRWLALQFEIDRGKGVTDSHPLMQPPVVRGAARD